MVEDLEVLPGGVHHLEHGLVGHQRQQRRQVEARRQGIDRHGLVLARDLDQAELGVVGAVAHELGVDRDEALGAHPAAEGGQGFVVGDQRHGGGSHLRASASLDTTRARRALCPPARRARAPSRWSATETSMHPYRTHRCGDLRPSDVGNEVRLSGWVHRKRDHGQLLFIDLRDHAGIMQLVFQPGTAPFAAAEAVRVESVITVTGRGGGPHARDRQPDAADRRGRAGGRGCSCSTRRPRRCRCRSTASGTIPRRPG